jgi:uncharacterized membrane-anchored protein YjiN (DUF445 family)
MAAIQTTRTEDQLRGLRRMKIIALVLLLVAAATYLLARKMEVESDAAFWGYLRAAAEAGVVGGLADWFAVTALFRRPLGLPIPHTALIPSKKDQLGKSLSDFVHGNFLSAGNVRQKVLATQPALRISEYLEDANHRRRVVSEGSSLAVELIENLNDAEIQLYVRNSVFTELQRVAWGPPAGKLLQAAISDGKHHGVVDAVLIALHRWLLENRDRVAAVVADRGPVSQTGPVRWVHERIGDKAVDMVTEFVGDLRDNPTDPVRQQLDEALLRIAEEMRDDDLMIGRVESWKGDVLRHPETHRVVNSIWPTAKELVLEALQDPDSDLRQRADTYLASVAVRLRDDPEFATSVDARIGAGVAYLVDRYGEDAVAVISETVQRWDASEASRKIELAVGKDLQYIRINGTIVGSLAGLSIYTISGWLL